MYKFKTTLEELGKTVKQLPDEIKASIDLLEKQNLSLEEITEGEEDPDEVRQIQIDIRALDDNISEAIRDHFDDELDAEKTDEDKREEILEELYAKGKKSITQEALVKLGYPYSGQISRAQAGGYRLDPPDRFSKAYKIVKL